MTEPTFVRLVLLTLLVLATVGSVSAADRIYLTCSGKGILHDGLEFPEPDARFIIDLDQGTVETTLGWSGYFASKPHIRPVDFSITSATEASIEFKGSHGDTPICPILGKIDRLSGSATVRQFIGETAELLRWYELDCKRTKPVF